MTKQENNQRCFDMAIGLMLGVVLTALSFAVAEHNKTYTVVIEKPITAKIETKHWAMERLE